jgi:hypothetical protein
MNYKEIYGFVEFSKSSINYTEPCFDSPRGMWEIKTEHGLYREEDLGIAFSQAMNYWNYRNDKNQFVFGSFNK